MSIVTCFYAHLHSVHSSGGQIDPQRKDLLLFCCTKLLESIDFFIFIFYFLCVFMVQVRAKNVIQFRVLICLGLDPSDEHSIKLLKTLSFRNIYPHHIDGWGWSVTQTYLTNASVMHYCRYFYFLNGMTLELLEDKSNTASIFNDNCS